MNDGTQERTLQPPDDSLSDADMRECERAAADGWAMRDSRSREWLEEQLADTPEDVAAIVRATLAATRKLRDAHLPIGIYLLVHRYVAECAEEYWGDLIEQEKYAQEP